MKIAIAADHAGYALKQTVAKNLKKDERHEVVDVGTHDPDESDDYPDFVQLACEAVRQGRAERAVIVCGSGVGASVAANKFPGIRAGLCHDHYSAHQGVEHDDMNVLCLGARVIGEALALEIVQAFIEANFNPEQRHIRRVNKVKSIEAKFTKN
jgi:ribose 5-phosphate isomerase B